jgi:uncharacterized phage protein gp47/JayE
MTIPLQDFSGFVKDYADTLSSQLALTPNLGVGSVFRALAEGVAQQSVFLEALAMELLARTRSATSGGTDLDTWMADYAFVRLPAVAATGQVVFSRTDADILAVVPIGALVQTDGDSQQYSVVLDTTHSLYSENEAGYVLPVGTASASLPVQALVAGAAGNAAIGAVNLLGEAIVGVDAITNPAAFVNGQDAENDSDFRARFVLYINSLSKATKAAIGSAIMGVKQGLSYSILENQAVDGTAQYGMVTVVLDDGTGYPSSTLLSTVANAIDAVRACGITYSVMAPTVITANISLSITTASGSQHSAVVGTVAAAVADFVNGLGLSNDLQYTRLHQVAYDASPYVVNVSNLLLNGTTLDLTTNEKQTIKTGALTVN